MLSAKKKPPFKFNLEISIPKVDWNTEEWIDGTIILRVKDESLPISSLRVRLEGVETYIKPTHALSEKSRREKSRQFFEVHTAVPHPSKENTGEVSYPFQLLIPSNIPPSMDWPGRATISYNLQAEITLAGSKPTIVKFPVFIHSSPSKELPPTFVDKKESGVMHNKTLLLRCVTPRFLWNCGEFCHLELTISNQTRKNVTRVLFGLLQSIKVGKVVEEKLIFHTDAMKVIPVGGKLEAESIDFMIPRGLPASSKSRSIEVLYYVHFTCEFESGGGWASRMPIAIGSPPFVEEKSDQEMSEQQEQVPNNPPEIDLHKENQEPQILGERKPRKKRHENDSAKAIPSETQTFPQENVTTFENKD